MSAVFCVGLTGGVACGKSVVESAFAALGVPVLDADQVARAVVAPGSPQLAQIAKCFGVEFLLPDGSLNRRRMREHVFADADARRQLEAITHPAIRVAIRSWRDAQISDYCVVSVAILIEAGMVDLVDRVLVVDCPESLQRERLMARDGIDQLLATRILAAQIDRERRLAMADDVLTNSGTEQALISAVEKMDVRYRALAAELLANRSDLPQRAC